MEQGTIKEISPKEIKSITLLSIEEVEKFPREILFSNRSWWLRSIGCNPIEAAIVFCDDGFVNISSSGVYDDDYSVRPALIFNPNSSNLGNGDIVEVFDRKWYYKDGMALLVDEPLTYMAFREDWRADDANDYEKSDIKKYLDNWFKKKKEE